MFTPAQNPRGAARITFMRPSLCQIIAAAAALREGAACERSNRQREGEKKRQREVPHYLSPMLCLSVSPSYALPPMKPLKERLPRAGQVGKHVVGGCRIDGGGS